MIYTIIILGLIFILRTTKSTLNRHHGKISENPLRKKLVDDTLNTILFLILFWCSYHLYSKKLSIISLSIIVIALKLFLHKETIKNLFWGIIDKFREKIAFSASILNLIRRFLKNWKISSSKGTFPSNKFPKQALYREYITLSIILFCKRAIITLVGILMLVYFFTLYFPNVIENISWQIQNFQNTFLDIFVLINNTGLVFTCWKFHCDYIDISKEKSDDERYIELVKRLERNEHEI